MAASAGMPRNNGVSKTSVRKHNTAATRLASWVRAPAATATEVLDRLPTTRKPPKRPLRILAGVCDEFLVGIDVAAGLYRRGLCTTERLGIADQHNGKRAGHAVLQFCRVELGQREVGQAGG
jgi:hypothetical protein